MHSKFMKKGVLIIGNGFDLDFGLKTTFNDIFADWKPDGIITFTSLYRLVNKNNRNEWNFLEDSIGQIYANNEYSSINDFDKEEDCHEAMRLKIIKYLKSLDYKQNDSSYASRLIKAISQNGKFDVYSFNYTNTVDFITNSKLNVNHVHGKAIDSTAILGTEDNQKAIKELCFLQKSFSPYYSSTSLKYDLNNADTVIFFGHSLGKADFLYFKNFFKAQSTDGLEESKKKKIILITYDEYNRRKLLYQLFSMNNKRLDLFFQQNEFEVILTDLSDTNRSQYETKFEELLKYLHDNSLQANRDRLQRIASRI